MRRRPGRFLPIVLLALLVQILAPIGVSWATSIALSDPLASAVICSGSVTGGHHQPRQHGPDDACCSVCTVAQSSGSALESRFETFTIPDRPTQNLLWSFEAPSLL